jgi:16S rRNA (guanine1207-N2)-methyltransferase
MMTATGAGDGPSGRQIGRARPALAEGYRVATPEDISFKKVVTFRHRDRTLRLRVAQELFSSQAVDVGTGRLLRSLLDARLESAGVVLDLGCGYGPIGLALKQADPTRAVHLVDRDALAVAYARQNAALNGLDDVEVYGSLDYADARRADFDLIASNIPAKAGEPAIAHFLRGAAGSLRPGGLVAVVVVSRIEAMVEGILTDPAIEIVWRKPWPGHTVFHFRFTAAPKPPPAEIEGQGDDLSPYWLGNVAATAAGRRFSLRAAASLPETEAMDVQTELAIAALGNLRGMMAPRCLFFNPGQGYAPVAAHHLLRPSALGLVDRDLLALRVTRRNLMLNGRGAETVTISHQVDLTLLGDVSLDLVVGLLRDEDGPAVHARLAEQAAARLASGGVMVAAGSSTAITRLVVAVRAGRRLRIEDRQRRKGRGLLVMRRA